MPGAIEGNRFQRADEILRRIAELPKELGESVTTLRSHPIHLQKAIEILNSGEVDERMVTALQSIMDIDSSTWALQLAESFLLEGNECLHAGDYLSAASLLEIASRMCRNAEALGISEVSVKGAILWRGEATANLGAVYLNAGEPTLAARQLEQAKRIMHSVDYMPAVHECDALLKKALSAMETAPAVVQPEDISLEEIGAQAAEALWNDQAFQYLELTRQAIHLMDESSLGERIACGRGLLWEFFIDDKKSMFIRSLDNILEQNQDVLAFRDPRFIWLHFSRAHAYGVISRQSVLYLITHLVEALSISIPDIVERRLFRDAFVNEREEAIRWALTSGRLLMAMRLADQTKARTSLDLALAGRGDDSDPATSHEFSLVASPSVRGAAQANAQASIDSEIQRHHKRILEIGQFTSRVRKAGGPATVRDGEEVLPYFAINAASRLAAAGALIVEYALLDDHLHVYALASSRHTDEKEPIRHWIVQVGIGSDSLLERACRDLRAEIDTRDRTAAERAARALYDLVIGDVGDAWNSDCQADVPLRDLMARYSKLVVVPSGPLAAIPWAALHTGRQWLWQSHTINVIPSLSFLFAREIAPRPMLRSISSVLLVENPTEDLEGAETECQEIAEHLESVGLPYVRVSGSEATVERIKELAPAHDVLHFASHGLHVSDEPSSSGIILADGTITAPEIGSMDLEGKAIIFSCCESGVGETDVGWGDDALSVGHASLIAGARYCISSLWRVSDEATPFLMVRLYSSLLDGNPPSVALVNAVSATATEFDAPDDWAAFQVIGAPEDMNALTIMHDAVLPRSPGLGAR